MQYVLTHFSSELNVPKTATLIQVSDARLANGPFLVFDFPALWHLSLSACRVPESQKIKMVR